MVQNTGTTEGYKLPLGIIGCFGGLLIHLVIGSLYQWGIINIYITSYYRLLDPNVTLENNAIAFPIMMICIGLTMRLGLFISEKTHPLLVMGIVVVFQSLFIFVSSYVTGIAGFIIIYGVMFGLVSGFNFMVPIVECNKYFPGKKMYVNGIVLTGTGMGSVVFGLFSYYFLNPNKVTPLNGYYIGNEERELIALKVPECIRWLSLLYLSIGLLGVLMLCYVCTHNRRIEKEISNTTESLKKSEEISKQNVLTKTPTNEIELNITKNDTIQNLDNTLKRENQSEGIDPSPTSAPIKTSNSLLPSYPKTIFEALFTKVSFSIAGICFFGSCGLFLINGNYKTYVKSSMSNDDLLTIVGVIGGIGNGVSRFFWNLLFNQTGYKFVMIFNIAIQIVIFSTIRFTVLSEGGYLFLVLLGGICMGGFLVMTPTVLQIILGPLVGSNIYGIFWEIFGIANLIHFAYVSGLVKIISFNNVIYICLGMSILSGILILFTNFKAPWDNPIEELGYCKLCTNKENINK